MNALTVDMALGCSTNSMLHLPAIAHEAGVELNVDIANEVSARTPNLCHLAPAGPTYMEDLNEAGGVYAVMNELTKKNLLNTGLHDCDRKDRRREYRRTASTVTRKLSAPSTIPTAQTGGLAILEGQSGTGLRRCKTFRCCA